MGICLRLAAFFHTVFPLCDRRGQCALFQRKPGPSKLQIFLYCPVVSSNVRSDPPPVQQGPSHVVSHVYGVQLVGQESVSEVHALLLPSGVDGDDAGVDHHHHPHNEVVLLQDDVSDQSHQVQGLLLGSLQLHDHHEEVGPGKHRAGGRRRWWMQKGENNIYGRKRLEVRNHGE